MGDYFDYIARHDPGHVRRLGTRIVDNWRNSALDRARCGDCFQVTYDRVEKAMRDVGEAKTLGPYTRRRMFCAIWGSHIEIG